MNAVEAARRLAEAGVDNPRLDARLLLAEADQDAGRAAGLVARRAAREPLAYILGRKEFWSLDFRIGPGVLVPRPETETLVEAALKAFPGRDAPLNILDLGTGSGCLLIALLHERPNATGAGVDASPEALAFARSNAERHGVAGRCTFVQGGWDAGESAAYDIVLSNPPYIPSDEIAGLAPEVALYEPQAALDGGPDGLGAYRALGPELARCLKPRGRGLVEVGQGQAEAVCALFRDAGLTPSPPIADLAGIPRVVETTGRGQKAGNP